jgi:Flp pilus assembly protein TadG
MIRNEHRRSGVHLVECAFVYPVLFIVLLGMMVGSMGVFRYQQVAYMAREAARFASVHGAEYQTDNAAAITANTLPNPTEAYITNNLVMANAAAMDTSLLSVTIMFNQSTGSTT